MAEATPSNHRSSSLLYALGRVEAQVAAQAETIKDLPAQIVAIIEPRLAMIPDHETRLRSLERTRWVVFGGGGLAVIVIGWLVNLAK